MGGNGENTLPEGWEVKRIDQLGQVQGGRQLSPHLTQGTPRPYLRVANVQQGFITTNDVKQMPFTDEEYETYRLRPGDLLLNEGQDIELVGRCAVYQGVPQNCCFQNTLIRFRPANGMNPWFAHFLFEHLRIQGRFAAVAVQTTSIAHLGVSRLASMQAWCPPLPEQDRIASILSAWLKAESLCVDLLTAKVRLRSALLYLLLNGKRRLTEGNVDGEVTGQGPDIDTLAENGLIDIPRLPGEKSYLPGIPKLGPIPSGWREVAFGDVLEVVERPVLLEDDETYQLVTAKRGRGGIVPRETLLGRQIRTKTQFCVAKGDFLISRRQIIHGACGVVPSSLDGAVVSNEYSTLRVKDGLLLDYLRYLSHTDYFQMTCFHSSVGVAVEKMVFRLEEWLKHKIHLPPEKEQRRIASCIGWLDHEILLLFRQREALKKQKKGLMQLLLTGKLRVRTE